MILYQATDGAAHTCYITIDPTRIEGPAVDPLIMVQNHLAAQQTRANWRTLSAIARNPDLVHCANTIGAFTYPENSIRYHHALPDTHRVTKRFDINGPAFFSQTYARRALLRSLNIIDNIALVVLLGAWTKGGERPFSHNQKTIFTPRDLLLLAAATRSLHPWIGDHRIPSQGYHSRFFSKNANLQTSLERAPAFFRQNKISQLLRQDVMAPDRHCHATRLTISETIHPLARALPQQLIAAGAAIWAQVPDGDFAANWEIKDFFIPEENTTISAHQRMEYLTVCLELDTALVELAPDFARKRKRGASNAPPVPKRKQH